MAFQAIGTECAKALKHILPEEVLVPSTKTDKKILSKKGNILVIGENIAVSRKIQRKEL